MTQRENILKELNELGSGIAGINLPGYQVPEGYFDALAGEIMKRVAALEATSPQQELEHLSPLLNSIPRNTPFSVPPGYFREATKNIDKIASGEQENAGKEESVFAFNGLRNKPTYTVPEGYFENLSVNINKKIKGADTKVVPFAKRKWIRYAAAATVIAFVAIFAFVLPGKKNVDPETKSYAWVEKNLKKVSTDEISEFVESVTLEKPDVAKLDTREEVSSMLKDVSDKEIEDFLNDTQVGEAANDDDQILN